MATTYQELVDQLNNTLGNSGTTTNNTAISPYNFNDWLKTQGDYSYNQTNNSINNLQIDATNFSGISNEGYGTEDAYKSILDQYNQVKKQQEALITPVVTSPTTTATGQTEEGQYISPYQQQMQELMNQLGQVTPYQTPAELEQYLMSLLSSAQQPFTYDPNSDVGLQNAQQEAGRQVREAMGNKNLLYSSNTISNVAQQQGALVPEFEMKAYTRYADQKNREIQMATTLMEWDQMQAQRWTDQLNLITTKFNYIMQLDSQEFEKFQLLLDQRNFEKEYQLQQQQQQLARQQMEIEQAYAKVDAMGYVDKNASVILGIPVGTKAQWVLELEKEQANQLALLKKEYENQLALQKKQATIDKSLVDYKAKLDEAAQKKLMTEQYKLDKQLAEYQHSMEMGGKVGNSGVVASAYSLLGVKYVYGGTSTTKGLDCSALTQWAMKQNGVSLPRTAMEQSKVGTKVSWNNLQSGDLVFFNTIDGNGKNVDHVGIYVGNGQMLHASSGKGKVVVVDMKTSYWEDRFTVGRRITTSGSGKVSSGSSGSSSSVGRNSSVYSTRAIQYALNSHGFKTAIDNKYGPSTTAQVKAFQKKYGLTVDGNVGPKTIAKMESLGYF